jgi:predicted esterase
MINITKGWNLFGAVEDINILSMEFKCIESIYIYRNNKFVLFETNGNRKSFDTLKSGDGFWMYSKSSCKEDTNVIKQYDICSNPSGNIKRGSIVSYKLLNEDGFSKNYSLIYYTKNYKNKIIKASGYASLPKTTSKKVKILEFNRGTSDRNDLSPSQGLNTSYKNMLLAMKGAILLAEKSFAIVLPDYTGYGVSKDIHPYGTRHIAHSLVDIIRATKHLLKEKKIEYDNEVYIMGYSEGGQASMATHEQINTCYKNEINVRGSIPMAGPYDPLVTMERTIKQDIATYSKPTYLLYYIFSYAFIYNDTKMLDTILQPSMATTLKNLIINNNPSGIFDIKNVSSKDIINPKFIEDVKNNKMPEKIKTYLSQHNTYKWKVPNNTMRLYHSFTDEIVPYENSVKAIKYFQKNNIEVELIDLAGSHEDAAATAITLGLQWILNK